MVKSSGLQHRVRGSNPYSIRFFILSFVIDVIDSSSRFARRVVFKLLSQFHESPACRSKNLPVKRGIRPLPSPRSAVEFISPLHRPMFPRSFSTNFRHPKMWKDFTTRSFSYLLLSVNRISPSNQGKDLLQTQFWRGCGCNSYSLSLHVNSPKRINTIKD